MIVSTKLPIWTYAAPVAGWVVFGLCAALGANGILALIAFAALMASVFAAVFHAEVIAHRVGEPYGTLVLALAVTVIEVALIVSVLAAGGKAELPRDTVFAVVMLVCNGIVGLCLLVGGARHREQDFHVQGASAALAVLAALTTLTLILPVVTTTVPGPILSTSQLIFIGAVSIVLYAGFVFIQTVRHRDYFLPPKGKKTEHAAPPSNRITLMSVGLLLAALVVIVGLAKILTPAVENGITKLGWPDAVVGIVIAALVLLPEGVAAVRAARANRLQTSLNLALGSALASIGLTIPAVAIVSTLFKLPIQLGLGTKEIILLAITLFISVITLGTGRTTVLQGIVHLVILATFLFFAIVP